MAIAFVNSGSVLAADAGTSVAIPAENHTTGNLLVVMVYGYSSGNSPTVSSVTDTAGNSYSRAVYFRSVNYTLEIFYAYNVTGNASNVVTANYSASSIYRIAMVHQYSGCLTTSAVVDVTSTGTGSGTALATTAVSTNYADEVIVSAFNINQVPTFTEGTGFTLRENQSIQQSEDRIVSSTGSYAATMTSGTSGDWIGIHATFRAAVASSIMRQMMAHHGG